MVSCFFAGSGHFMLSQGMHSISRVRHKKKFRRNGGLRKLCILVENMGFRMVSGLV